MTTDISIADASAAMERRELMTARDVVAQVQRIQQIMEAVMIEGVHYGKIPGTDKDALYKAGAEKLGLTFRLTPRFRVQEEHDRETGYYKARVTCELFTIGGGIFVGEGVGSASSEEEKYKWVAAVCQEQWDEMDPAFRRKKYVRKGDGHEVILQVQANLADRENTILKMGKKRAYIDAIISVTAAGDIFRQELEDDSVITDDEKRAAKPTKAKPQPAVMINYGKAKGKAINDPSIEVNELKSYLHGAEAALDKPERQRFRAQNEAFIGALRGEIARREQAAKTAEKAMDVSPPDDAEMQQWLGYCERMAKAAPQEFVAVLGMIGIELADPANRAQRDAAARLVQASDREEIKRRVGEARLTADLKAQP